MALPGRRQILNRIAWLLAMSAAVSGITGCWTNPPEVEARAIYLGPMEMVQVISTDTRPFSIYGFTVNGEWHPTYGATGPLKLPHQMTQGAGFAFLLSAPYGTDELIKASYPKEMVTLEIKTSLGNVTRHSVD